MSTFVLIPGAGGDASYWDEFADALEARGHDAIPVDIREDNPALGLPEYAELVDAAIGEHTGVVLVAQSLGGFTAPMVTKRDALRMVVLVNAMIPLPGEAPADWWENTGSSAARRAADEAAGRSGEFDLDTYFLHDLPDEAKARLLAGEEREPSDTAFAQPCAFERWPDVPIKVVVGADDRFFPAEFQRRVAKERLGLDVDVLPGGHLVAMSRPGELANLLVRYLG